jgi:hypothetical protein
MLAKTHWSNLYMVYSVQDVRISFICMLHVAQMMYDIKYNIKSFQGGRLCTLCLGNFRAFCIIAFTYLTFLPVC